LARTVAKAAGESSTSGQDFETTLVWEFLPAKPEVTPKDDFFAPRLLMAIKLAHYFTFVAQGGVTWMLFQARGYLASANLTDLGVFLLILGSVYQAMAGAFFIMAHEYDGWQIGDFAWPDKTGPDPEVANNDRLRLVSYQFLFWFQSLGMGMTAFAISLGGAFPDPKVAAGLLVGWFFLSLWKPNDLLNKFCKFLGGSWPCCEPQGLPCLCS